MYYFFLVLNSLQPIWFDIVYTFEKMVQFVKGKKYDPNS